MSVITISRGSYSHGREVAEKLAGRLGYACMSREIILSASRCFNIPEMSLVRAVHDAPTVLDRFTYGKQRYVAYVRQALLNCLQRDNTVYHGLGGHYFVRGVPHVLKVRIIADLEDRVAEEMRREGLSAEEARRALLKDDEARSRWGHYILGIDSTDPRHYDLIVHIGSLTVDEAVEVIVRTVKLPCFQTTFESRKALHFRFLAARIQAVLMEEIPSIKVGVKNDEIIVVARLHLSEGKRLLAKINHLVDTEREKVRIKIKLTAR